MAFRSFQVHSGQITIFCLNQEERGFVTLILIGFVMSFVLSPRCMIIEENQALIKLADVAVPVVVLLTTQSKLKTIQAVTSGHGADTPH